MRSNLPPRLIAIQFLCSVTLIISPQSAMSLPITPVALSSGYTLTGSITTDGTIGSLSSSDITAWNWTATGPSSFSQSFSGPTSTESLDLTSTSTTLSISFPPDGGPPYPYTANGGHLYLISPTTTTPYAYWETAVTDPGPNNPQPIWQAVIGYDDFPTTYSGGYTSPTLPSAPLTIATAVPTPEPATITLLGSAILLLGGFRLLRRRRGALAIPVAH